ncbi:hypothetical protein ACOI1H_21510, partial [Loktanella sp. DJP18]|uniref:hypothetical protein n=1 Tax=Loktanella sp. DJP18 TaxID=3409788 RepID=UPI003BB7209E
RIASLNFSEYDGAPQIQMIKVAKNRRRSGHATRLLAALQTRYPDHEIDWGCLTDQGAALKAALPVRLVPTPQAPDFPRLDRLRLRLAAMECRISDLHAARQSKDAVITAYYCLERHVEDLARQLDRCTPNITILALDPVSVTAS